MYVHGLSHYINIHGLLWFASLKIVYYEYYEYYEEAQPCYGKIEAY